MEEHSDKPLERIAYCYLGDARNNMGNSLLLVGAGWAWTCGSRPEVAVARRRGRAPARSLPKESGGRSR